MSPFWKSASVVCLASAGLAAEVDYLREVKPVLTEHCVSCHGADRPKGGLRLDTAVAALRGGGRGPAFVPGKPSESLALRVAEGPHDDLERMPYKKPPLAPGQVAVLRRWVAAGAAVPPEEKPGVDVHWAFVPPKRPELPAVADLSRVRNPIDRFVLARLDQAGIAPSPEADRITLLRRVSLDLTGLPPTPAEVDAFLADSRPDAYERAVDALLASPHHGERWARWWLDIARYADSNGYSIDAPRTIWPWRDWVIGALNDDKPFDRFVVEQLAGDLLADAAVGATGPAAEARNQDLRVATGFHRNTQINEEGGIDPEQFRIESVIDRVDTTGIALLGLTVGCSRCHDHKFDPVSQREYFQLFAFFNDQDEPAIEAATPADRAVRDAVRTRTRPIHDELDAALAALEPMFVRWESGLTPEARAKLPLEVRNVLGLLPADRKPAQVKLVREAHCRTDAGYRAIEERLRASRRDEPKIPTTLVLAERKQPRESYVFIKGDFTRRGPDVSPGTPAVLHPFPAPKDGSARPTRLDFARWLVDPAGPLFARVAVNRVWQQYFGRGIVETENDFGTQGIPPTHPELLDWLAVELMKPASGVRRPGSGKEHAAGPRAPDPSPETPDARSWSLKRLHRLIVTSATYRRSSKARPDLAEKDPANRLLARQDRLRLDAEIIRDVALAASGRLDRRIGGPGVFPPQPDGVMALGQSRRDWKASTGADRFRRGLYTFFWRATPHPALAVFDAPDAFSACTRRMRSNTPLQALTLLNDEAFVELAGSLARRVVREAQEPDRIDHAFRLCLARPPKPAERERLVALLAEERREGDETAAWTTLARVLLNLDETITRE